MEVKTIREILFKAKSIDKYENGNWVEGYVFDDDYENGRLFVGSLEIQEYKGSACDDWSIVGHCFYEVDPSTLCQFTGLKDKNGDKIWENDIVRLDEDLYIVTWEEDDAMFALEDVGVVEHFSNVDSKWCEVVGNKFDNPELI